MAESDLFMVDTSSSRKDTDLDSIPDEWELANDLDIAANDAALDPDGDGRSNLEEYNVFLDDENWVMAGLKSVRKGSTEGSLAQVPMSRSSSATGTYSVLHHDVRKLIEIDENNDEYDCWVKISPGNYDCPSEGVIRGGDCSD